MQREGPTRGSGLALPLFNNWTQPKFALTVGFAWHGRGQLPGSDRHLVSRDGRPQLTGPMGDRSVLAAGRWQLPRQRRGAAPAPRFGGGARKLGVRDRENYGVQGQRPCVGGVPASARASDRCCLPSEVENSVEGHAQRGDRPGRGACPRPCQAMGGGRELGVT